MNDIPILEVMHLVVVLGARVQSLEALNKRFLIKMSYNFGESQSRVFGGLCEGNASCGTSGPSEQLPGSWL